MSYLYDAISGKVREMVYNKGKKDEFRHRFAYDAMGNLKYVWTSRDGRHWTLESALKYYPDGKLMRREIRPKDLMLQGLDYAYTLDGWLKAINSEVLENDPSQDGISGTYEYFARDVFSLLLRYYPNDYKPIKPNAVSLEAAIISGNSHLYKPYYTGWISSWSLNLDTLHTAYSFRYDRLGRLTKATTLEGFDGTEWNANLVKNYSTKYSYDLVGNILSLTRYGSDTNAIDILTYEYYNRSRNNRLKRIVDAVNTPIPIDLETQPNNNYLYDAVGNMIEDKSRNMQVFYTYSNKPKRINLGGQTIRMLYNPSGYRFFKGKGPNKGQIFVYNSQGQLMAKYTIDGKKLRLDFMPIYEGTKRLGILEPSGVLWIDCPPPRLCFEEDSLGFVQLLVPSGGGIGEVLKAERKYELVDHLDNVRVVIRAQRVPVSTDGSTVAYYKPLVHEISDYYPYGWQKILGRYQFGANAGSLFEDWDSSRGTYYTLYRLLDARIARWYQVEPMWERYVWLSPYVVNSGNPVIYFDILGDKIKGFWIDSAGNVKYNPEEASKEAIRIWNIVKETEMGRDYFKRLIEIPTEVRIKIRKRPLAKGYSYAKTRGGRIGIYHKRAKVVLSEYTKEGVWDTLSLTSEHRLGTTFVHEAYHLTDEENLRAQQKAEELGVKYKEVREIEEPPLNAMAEMLRQMFEVEGKYSQEEKETKIKIFRRRFYDWLYKHTKPFTYYIKNDN